MGLLLDRSLNNFSTELKWVFSPDRSSRRSIEMVRIFTFQMWRAKTGIEIASQVISRAQHYIYIYKQPPTALQCQKLFWNLFWTDIKERLNTLSIFLFSLEWTDSFIDHNRSQWGLKFSGQEHSWRLGAEGMTGKSWITLPTQCWYKERRLAAENIQKHVSWENLATPMPRV